jgi:hypothetical protein
MSRAKSPAAQSVPSVLPFTFPSIDADLRPRWGEVDPVVIRAFIAAYTDVGAGVLFGRTKDQSALNLCIYIDNNKQNYVYGHSEAATNALRQYTEWAMSYLSHGLTPLA